MIKTISPSSPILKKYIDCFYFFSGDTSSKFRYLAFPHYHIGMSMIKGATIDRQNWHVGISENGKRNVSIEILGRYLYPLLIEYTGKVQEISIIFKPLGLNHFFREPYLFLAPQPSQELISESWKKFGETLLFEEKDLPELESFLLSQFTENSALLPLEESLLILDNIFDKSTISEIAKELGFNLKTFQRQFKKYVGCSPVEYRRICRFRHSIGSKLNNIQFKSLTELTYEGGYFDQSYFIKEFKKMTKHNPRDFFKSIHQVDGDKLIWEIL